MLSNCSKVISMATETTKTVATWARRQVGEHNKAGGTMHRVISYFWGRAKLLSFPKAWIVEVEVPMCFFSNN